MPKSKIKSERSLHYSPDRQLFNSTVTATKIQIKDQTLIDSVELIENQIKEKAHPLNWVLALFDKYYGDYYLEYCCSATAYFNHET